MVEVSERLRVALLAGTLGQGGAEKQLVYFAAGLLRAGVDVQVFSLTRGEFYEAALASLGIAPLWAGPTASPVRRLLTLARMMRRFQPHVIQSVHTFTNLYASAIGRALGCISIGTMISTLDHTRRGNGAWFRWLVSTPDALLVNSRRAVTELIESRSVPSHRLWFCPNFIDVAEFDASVASRPDRGDAVREQCRVAFVGRLIPAKRVDRFLRALAVACRHHRALEGIVVGEGPMRVPLEKLAAEAGLLPHKVRFLGIRNDVPDLLCQSDFLVLCSDHEGFPNVLLEAMAARLPVVTTPAGEAGLVVQDGVTGYVVDFDDIDGLADRMVRLTGSPELRKRFGEAGRQRVVRQYNADVLPSQLFAMYSDVAGRRGDRSVIAALGLS